MAEIFPIGVDTTSGRPIQGKIVDSIPMNLSGWTGKGLGRRISNGTFSVGGDNIYTQKFSSSFAVASTHAESAFISLPPNCFILMAAVYVEVPGDAVSTLQLGVRISGSDIFIDSVDGLVAGTSIWTTLVNNEGNIYAGPVDIVCTADSTGGNLNTMTTGTFDFAVSYITFGG